MRNALKFLTGSAATYLLMAACSAAATGPLADGRHGGGAPMVMMTSGGADSTGTGLTDSGGADSTGGSVEMPVGIAGASVAQAGAGVARAGAGSSLGGMLGMMTDPVPDASAEPAMDGSRLKAVYLVGADGSRQWNYTWWDSQRNEECSFLPFSDGTTRCVPAGSASASLFSDPGCTVPLYVAPVGSCQAVKYALVLGPLACGVYSYASINTLTPVNPDKVYSGTPAACLDVTATYKPLYSFYVGTAVPLGSFATATKEHG